MALNGRQSEIAALRDRTEILRSICRDAKSQEGISSKYLTDSAVKWPTIHGTIVTSLVTYIVHCPLSRLQYVMSNIHCPLTRML